MKVKILWLFIIAHFLFCTSIYAQPSGKCNAVRSARVLIIQDELQQMEVLSKFLSDNQEDLDIDIVKQNNLPEDLRMFHAIIVYLHFRLHEETEAKIIDYTNKGGRLIVLHHSISSGKARNKNFFPFLGVQLDGTNNSRDPEPPGGGYVWIEGVTFTLVNLNPDHCVINHNVEWGEEINYTPSDVINPGSSYPTISLHDSEVYLNHKFTDDSDKTILMGLKFYDIRNDQLFMQDRASWYKIAGEGDIFYFMPGHSSREFENENFAQMILNAINYTR